MAVRPISLQEKTRMVEGWPETIGTIVGAAVSVLTTAIILWPLMRHMFSGSFAILSGRKYSQPSPCLYRLYTCFLVGSQSCRG
jgi:hypothetical protein